MLNRLVRLFLIPAASLLIMGGRSSSGKGKGNVSKKEMERAHKRDRGATGRVVLYAVVLFVAGERDLLLVKAFGEVALHALVYAVLEVVLVQMKQDIYKHCRVHRNYAHNKLKGKGLRKRNRGEILKPLWEGRRTYLVGNVCSYGS
jgi:hypothetical protein